MNQEANQKRTKVFGLGIIRLVDSLPAGMCAETIGGQLLRSGNTVGAKYRAACKAFSKQEGLAHLRTAREKADESLYLMELLLESRLIDADRIGPLMAEANALLRVLHDECIAVQGELRGNA